MPDGVPETRMGITTGPNQTADSAIASLFVFESGHDLLGLDLFGAGKLINDETGAKPAKRRFANPGKQCQKGFAE